VNQVAEFPPFRPFPGLGSGALMTTVGGLRRREPDALRRTAVERVFDGEGRNRVTARCHLQARSDAPCVVLVHGLVGDLGSPYVVGTAAKAYAQGLHVVRLNARNCGGTEALAADSYHGGVTEDLRLVLVHLVEAMAMTRVYLVGFSLGGNMVLKLAGELGSGAPEELAGIATLSPCLDFGAAADRMNATAFGRACQRRFLVSLRQIVRRRKQLHDPGLDLRGIDAIRTIREFDDRYTAPMGGFDGVEHYYAEASAIRLMDRVRVPSLLVASRDDPLVPFEALESPAVRGNGALEVLATDRGGHVAFLGLRPARNGHYADGDRRWGENRMVQFCMHRERERGAGPTAW